ncbi:MAG: acyl-CoA dehydratase activase [Spirochaetes bacterium]|nr:acyl-CoA dehydratase activase [Spirochaetota bacterium]
MKNDKYILGIDAGSVALSIVTVSLDGEIVDVLYTFHRGKIVEEISRALSQLSLHNFNGIATTSSTPDIIRGAYRCDERVAFVEAARKRHGQIGSVLIVGGEKFGIATFDEKGNYLNYRSNSSCAAGTGSFLDQQARRLGLSIEDFTKRALSNSKEPPRIASRCAVFAKTDLIHAQQVGHSLEEICDGLCLGLARNIRDTLFSSELLRLPLVMAGGVSKNSAVVRHLEKLLGTLIQIDEYSHVFGAYGAALECLYADVNFPTIENPLALVVRGEKVRSYYYPPLELKGNDYPEFSGLKSYEFVTRSQRMSVPVEVDIYECISVKENVFLGIDIGSTSTKAALVHRNGKVLAALYTRTSGRPIEAVQNIFEAIDEIQQKEKISFEFLGVATTGSGRKFIGNVIGADVMIDEISAHARAAVELDPNVDTIIEIGGQDAKFTTLRNGRVTFAIMNNVCAAGTGSFIEEQAKKLDVPLSEYAKRAEGACAPLSSDRCTVFMERDLNYYLSENYAVEEILASVLHSVRDNYLLKVAGKAKIGERIFFQGATAKNRALVAAFEQKLGRKIRVSKYCHITGAYGAALALRDEMAIGTRFRGLRLHKLQIPIRSEICDLCTNHCKLSIAEVGNETVAFGFLCGRDYHTQKFVKDGFENKNLLSIRKKLLPKSKHTDVSKDFTVGIPAGLYLVEEVELWKRFFLRLGIKTITSERYDEAIVMGKEMAHAEFCAPIAAFHGHVHYLLQKADYVFVPFYFEKKSEIPSARRHYCYYSQFAPSVVWCAEEPSVRARILQPRIYGLWGMMQIKLSLYRELSRIPEFSESFFAVASAFDEALSEFETYNRRLKEYFAKNFPSGNDVEVLLLGRPYAVLAQEMNGSIPNIFARLGVRTWYMDMVSEDEKEIHPLSEAFHWHYAVKVLSAARIALRTKRLYPVLVTSFKCTPDSYVVEYFRDMLDEVGKPYLILQLDEHDSSVGYETRIEAAIRAFRNHLQTEENPPFTINANVSIPSEFLKGNFITDKNALMEKTLLVPNWDSFTGKLLVANLRHAGYDARLLEETAETIKKSLHINTGQCLPLSAVVQGVIDYVQKYNLSPSNTAVWLFKSTISCNIHMFPYYIERLLQQNFQEGIQIYLGDITFLDISLSVAIDSYFAYMFGGLLRKALCKIRPYEIEKGSADAAGAQALEILMKAFEAGTSKEQALREAVDLLKGVPIYKTSRPKVAIFGDLYVRDNDVMNQDLVRFIESLGAEVITTPYSDYMKIIADPYIRKWMHEGLYGGAAIAKVLQKTVPIFEKKYLAIFNEIIREPSYQPLENWQHALASVGLTAFHTGESMDNVLKVFSILRAHPDVALFVQTNPSYCCPSLITEAMAAEIERRTGVPIVTIEYDGVGGFKNSDIVPYLRYLQPKVHSKAKAM